MKRVVFALVVALAASGAARAQMGCHDFSGNDLETYAKPEMIFTVSYPETMTWVLEMGETKVKVRAMPPRMVGFQFGHSSSPVTPEAFAESVAGWKEVFEIDYGGTPVKVFASPENVENRAEYKAWLPYHGAGYAMDAMLESASPDCDYVTPLEAAIRTLRPNPDSTR